MKVVVDFDLCESNAVCMGVAPEVFEVRDDDFLYVLDETPPERAAAEGRGGRAALPQAGHLDRGGADPLRPTIVVVGRVRWPARRLPRRCALGGFDGRLDRSSATKAAPPYDRPPLSKQVLAGDWDRRSARAAGTADASTRVGLPRPGGPPVSTRCRGRSRHLDDGSTIDADGLVMACGADASAVAGTEATRRGACAAHPRRLPRPCARALDRRPRRGSSWSAPGSSAPRSPRPVAGRGSTSRWSSRSRCRSAGCSATRSAGSSPRSTVTTASTCGSAWASTVRGRR